MREWKNKSIGEILWGPREQLGRTVKRFAISVIMASLTALAVFFFFIVITALMESIFYIQVNKGTMALAAVILSFCDWISIFFYTMIILYERYELQGQPMDIREKIAKSWREIDKESEKEKVENKAENEDIESISLLPRSGFINFMIEMADALIALFLSLGAGMACAYVTLLSVMLFNSFLDIFDQWDLYVISWGSGILVAAWTFYSAYKRREKMHCYFITGI